MAIYDDDGQHVSTPRACSFIMSFAGWLAARLRQQRRYDRELYGLEHMLHCYG